MEISLEEKKAIETFKSWKDYNIRNKNKLLKADEIIKVQETILNLIKKLQKENELLLQRFSEPILKEAIKEKISELNLSILECKSLVHDDGKYKEHAKKSISFLKKQRDILEKLIEEREEK